MLDFLSNQKQLLFLDIFVVMLIKKSFSNALRNVFSSYRSSRVCLTSPEIAAFLQQMFRIFGIVLRF